MNIPIMTFFNNKGGVGKTSLVYHLSWMFKNLGKRVVAIDLDPQANLTAAFLTEDELEAIWNDEKAAKTIFQIIKPLTSVGDLQKPELIRIDKNFYLLAGDVQLSSFEETLSENWLFSMRDDNLYRPFRILTAFWQVAQMAGKKVKADWILMDVGPNLGAINRSALIASDFVVIPLGADLFSLQGLKNLGPALRSWQSLWKKRLENWKGPEFELPEGKMKPAGYIIQQHGVRLSRPVKAYDRWINKIPNVYRECVLKISPEGYKPEDDPLCLAQLKHYRSLVPMSQEARKPVFALMPADGAIGAHTTMVKEAYDDFENLAKKILNQCG